MEQRCITILLAFPLHVIFWLLSPGGEDSAFLNFTQTHTFSKGSSKVLCWYLRPVFALQGHADILRRSGPVCWSFSSLATWFLFSLELIIISESLLSFFTRNTNLAPEFTRKLKNFTQAGGYTRCFSFGHPGLGSLTYSRSVHWIFVLFWWKWILAPSPVL